MITRKLIDALKEEGCILDNSCKFVLAPTFTAFNLSRLALQEAGYHVRFECEEDCDELPWQGVLCEIPTYGFNHI